MKFGRGRNSFTVWRREGEASPAQRPHRHRSLPSPQSPSSTMATLESTAQAEVKMTLPPAAPYVRVDTLAIVSLRPLALGRLLFVLALVGADPPCLLGRISTHPEAAAARRPGLARPALLGGSPRVFDGQAQSTRARGPRHEPRWSGRQAVRCVPLSFPFSFAAGRVDGWTRLTALQLAHVAGWVGWMARWIGRASLDRADSLGDDGRAATRSERLGGLDRLLSSCRRPRSPLDPSISSLGRSCSPLSARCRLDVGCIGRLAIGSSLSGPPTCAGQTFLARPCHGNPARLAPCPFSLPHPETPTPAFHPALFFFAR